MNSRESRRHNTHYRCDDKHIKSLNTPTLAVRHARITGSRRSMFVQRIPSMLLPALALSASLPSLPGLPICGIYTPKPDNCANTTLAQQSDYAYYQSTSGIFTFAEVRYYSHKTSHTGNLLTHLIVPQLLPGNTRVQVIPIQLLCQQRLRLFRMLPILPLSV